jgi:hypothetical protein
MSSVNLWTEMAMITRERIANIEEDMADTKKRLSDAIIRGDAASAETWRLYLELKKLHLESARTELAREEQMEQMGDAEMFNADLYTQSKIKIENKQTPL